jgi:hypothetical protein
MHNLQPPTDNLYKFVALTGVVAALAALLWPTTVFYNLRIREFEFAAHTAAARAEFEVWQGAEINSNAQFQKNLESSLLLKQFMVEHPAEGLPADVRELSRQEAIRIDREKRELVAAHDKIVEKAAAADRALGMLESKRQEIGFLKWTATATATVAVVLFIAGVALAAVGFRLWYFRSQVHQDKILAAEAAKASTA